MSLASGAVRTTGFDADRHWLIVNDKGRYLSQRELPRMALISPQLTAGGLVLTAPGMPPLEVAGDSPGTLIDIAVILDRCTVVDCGDVAGEWLTQYFGRPARLARFYSETKRAIHPSFWKGDIDSSIEFSDAFPFMILSEASLADLNTRLTTPLPMNRFRPNIVLRGLQPYDEDRIHSLIAGDVTLQMVRPCTRCVITTTNQSTGEAQGPEPLATLKTFRWSKELRGAMFGQYAVVAAGVGGRLARDQRVDVVWK